MVDIEGSRKPDVRNPYAESVALENQYIGYLRRLVYMGISLFGLRHFKFYGVLLRSPHVNHEWFKIGLACTIGACRHWLQSRCSIISSVSHTPLAAILSIKAYVELYEGKMKKNAVNYKNYRNTTHAVMVLLLLATVAFNAALWPHYGWNSPFVLGIAFFGVIVQFLLMVPTYVQNAVGFVALTFFLQQYA